MSTSDIAYTEAARFGFSISITCVPSGGVETDLTGMVTSIDGFWYGERAPGVYGWSIGLSGTHYDRVLLAPGGVVRLYRSLTINGADVDGNLFWFEGYIQPGRVEVDYAFQRWSLTVVDVVTYLSARRSPVFAVGQLNVAATADTEIDSAADARDLSDEGEYLGLPPLDGEQAIDGDLGTLWISGKAPAITDVSVSNSYGNVAVNEVYNPGFGLDKQGYQWIELTARGTYEGSGLRLMTRYGILSIPGFQLGEPFGPHNPTPGDPDSLLTKARFAILCYSASKHRQLFGEIAHAPIYETPNSSSLDWGFNLDGRGDYIALHGQETGVPPTGAHQWCTMYVEDGEAMGAVWSGGTVSASPASPRPYIDVNFSGSSFAAGELEGWFVQCDYNPPGGVDLYNRQRRITGNDATSANVTRIYVEGGWVPYTSPYDYVPVVGDEVRLSPFPLATPSGVGPLWPSGDRVLAPDTGASMRTKVNLVFNGSGSWGMDTTPQPGWSGVAPDASLWPWIMLTPAEMSFALTSPLDDGEMTVYLGNTDGLTETGDIFIGAHGPMAYVSKDNETITLSIAWTNGTQPAGTLVYQARDDGAIQPYWPIKTLVVKRRQIPSTQGNVTPAEWRVIDRLRVFISNLDAPRFPGADDHWRDDWITGSSIVGFNNNTQTVNTWTLPGSASFMDPDGYLRVKHILFAILRMSDESNGRINEIELLPPGDVVSGSTANLTVAGFFRYVLAQMGVVEANIQVGNASTEYIGNFSTDTSGYTSVLSDLALRTGQVIWPGPKDDLVRVSYNPNWPTSVPTPVFMTFRPSNCRSARLVQKDDRSVSQAVVTVRDQDGNSAVGQWPPLPRDDGEIFIDTRVYNAPLSEANSIARWVFWDKVADVIEVVPVGPAPWGRPGEYRVNVEWRTSDGVDLTGSYVIRSVQHQIDIGAPDRPRSWVTTLELTRLIGT